MDALSKAMYKTHKHADRMLGYARDATRTDTPYKLWEQRHICFFLVVIGLAGKI